MRRTYSLDEKKKIIERLDDACRCNIRVVEFAREMNIPRARLYRWRREVAAAEKAAA